MPLDFTRLLWSAILGFVLFAEVPDLATFVGGTVIFTSVVYIAYRERARHHEAPV
jgi:drug/metabolite transporter (DMT)-like permease